MPLAPISPQGGNSSTWREARDALLAGNDLPGRWRGRTAFTVCEIGIGDASGFLDLWRIWRDDTRRPVRLHILAFEPRPLVAGELVRRARDYGPDVFRETLLARWPPPLPGVHRIEFDGGQVTLTLVFAPVGIALSRQTAQVDAYLLEPRPIRAAASRAGQDEPLSARDLARGLVRLAAPGATVAIAAGDPEMTEALRDAGFVAADTADTAVTASMIGMRLRDRTSNRRRDVFGMVQAGLDARDDDRHAVVVGAGLAGAGVAAALAHRGWRVTVIAADQAGGRPPAHRLAPQASHLAAALTPMVSRDDDFRARLTRAGSQRALARWGDLIEQGIARRCATVEVAADAELAAEWSETLRVRAFPENWVRAVDQGEASELAGLPLSGAGVYFADGLLVRPLALIAGLLNHGAIDRLPGRVSVMRKIGQKWCLIGEDSRILTTARTVVLANSLNTMALLRDSGLLHGLPKLAAAHALAGEIACIPVSLLGTGPRCIVGGVGYLLPEVAGHCVIGSTYVHGAARAEVTPAGQRGNLDKAASLLADGRERLGALTAGKLGGWAGWRAVLPGRLPAAGPLVHAPGVWIATGYASRGLTWSSLMGDLIGAALDNEPFPMENDLVRAVRPR